MVIADRVSETSCVFLTARIERNARLLIGSMATEKAVIPRCNYPI